MKRYRCQGIRNPKTDRIDAAIIAQYGIDYWFRPCRESDIESIRSELKLLGNQYHQRSYAGDPVCEYFLKKLLGLFCRAYNYSYRKSKIFSKNA